MLLTSGITIKIEGGNLHYYKSLGYNDIKVKDIINIPIEYLPKTSHKKVLIKCDNCGDEKESHYFAYNKYLKNSIDNEYLCYKCNDKNRKNTLLEKYGVDALIKNEEFNKKRKKTMLNKFGFEHQCKSDKIKKKIIKTNLDKYGVKYPAQNEEIRNKINETNLERYGNINSLINDKILEKTLKTMIDKYGVVCQFQRKDIDLSNKIKKSKIINVLKKEKNIINVDYDNSKFVVKCDQHKEHIFEINNHLYYQRKKYNIPICTICNPINNNVSGNEIVLLNFIKENYDGEIILNNRKIISPYELDVYLPELNLAFEYNGLYWHSEKHKEKNYHINKTDLCEKNNIQLIHIWEDDWLFKQDIIKSLILKKLNISNKIDAKKCEIKEISDKLSKEFLNNNHIQGYIKSKIRIGLFYENELVNLMTFSNNELLRFCNKLNVDVINGEKKIFNFFIDKYKQKELFAISNRSYQETFFNKLGFKVLEKTEPNCFFVKDFIRYDKLDDNESILKIYDSGNLKLKINI